jgi:hypothetical protein
MFRFATDILVSQAESSGPELDRNAFGSQMGKISHREERRGRKGSSYNRGRSLSPEFTGPVEPLAMSENRYVDIPSAATLF